MDKCIIIVILFLCNLGYASIDYYNIDNKIIAQAIYISEGGDNTKFPYGIKSINTYGNKEYAHKICLNTIKNNKKRFLNQSEYNDFIEFLGSRYCPVKAHKLNKNWVKNVKYHIERRIK